MSDAASTASSSAAYSDDSFMTPPSTPRTSSTGSSPGASPVRSPDDGAVSPQHVTSPTEAAASEARSPPPPAAGSATPASSSGAGAVVCIASDAGSSAGGDRRDPRAASRVWAAIVDERAPLLSGALRSHQPHARAVSPMERLAARELKKRHRGIAPNPDVGSGEGSVNMKRMCIGAIVRGTFARSRRDAPTVFRNGRDVVALAPARSATGPPGAGPGGDVVGAPPSLMTPSRPHVRSPTAELRCSQQNASLSNAGSASHSPRRMNITVASLSTVRSQSDVSPKSRTHDGLGRPKLSKAAAIRAMLAERSAGPRDRGASFPTADPHRPDHESRARAATPGPGAYDAFGSWERLRPSSRGGALPRASRLERGGSAAARQERGKVSAAAAHASRGALAAAVNEDLRQSTITTVVDLSDSGVPHAVRRPPPGGRKGLQTLSAVSIAERVRSAERGRPAFRL